MASSKSKKAPVKKGQNEGEEGQPVVTLEEALSLAQGHHRAGNYLLAERTYRDILRAVPDHFPTTHFLGILLFQAGNFDEARHYLQIAVDTKRRL
jgi:Flp pilus assembly protein TadD